MIIPKEAKNFLIINFDMVRYVPAQKSANVGTPAKEKVVNMSKKCEICGKAPVAGRSVSHSHKVSNRMFAPNIQRVNIVENGKRRKANVCTSCLKAGKVTRG